MSKNQLDPDLLDELDSASASVRSFEYGYLLLCKAIEEVRDVLEEVEESSQDLADPDVLLRIQALNEQLQLIDQSEDAETPRYEDDEFADELNQAESHWSFEEVSDAFEELKLDLDDLIPEITQALEDRLARLKGVTDMANDDAEPARLRVRDESAISAFEARADHFSKWAWDAYDYLTRAKFLEASD